MIAATLILCLTATVCLANVGNCPSPKLVDDFSLEKLAGTWYEIESSAGVEKLASKCSTYIIESKGKNKASLLHKYVSVLTGKTRSDFSEITTPKSSEPAKLQISPLKGTVLARKWPLWILDTDYETYFLAYSCQKKIVTFTEDVYIFANTKTVDDQKMMDLYAILKNKDINQKNLMKIDQEDKDCPK